MPNLEGGHGDCLCLCGLKSTSISSTSHGGTYCKDHLQNWEVWMKRRKRVHERLARIGRNPGDLLMNINEELRNVKEDKLMLEYLKIDTEFDKYRGNPAFFKLPVALPAKRDECGRQKPTYFTVMTKEEKNEIPAIDYVTVPDEMLKEKDVLPRNRNLYKSWKSKATYRDNKVLNNLSKVQKVEPHRPELNDLIIVGKTFSSGISRKSEATEEVIQLDKKTVEDRIIKDDLVDELADNNRKTSEFLSGEEKRSSEIHRRTFFKINCIEFYENSPSLEYCNSINVLFERSTNEVVPTERAVVIENLGTTAVRFYWRQYQKLKIFREFTNICPIVHHFKFNKNELLLLPNEKLQFPIWFTAREPGGFCENWEITTLPKVFDEDYHLIISLKGFVFIQNFDTFCTDFENVLDTKISHTVVRDILDEVIKKGNYCVETEKISYDFTEKQTFESQNLEKDVSVLTPKYVYNKTVVRQLKEFYKSVRQPKDPADWNLSVKTLKQLTRQKDILIFAEEKSAEYAKAKMKRDNLKENADNIFNKKADKNIEKEEKKSGTAKSSAAKSNKERESNAVEKSIKVSYFSNLENILKKLLRPSMIENIDRRKHALSFLVIKSYLIKMFDEIDTLETKCFIFSSPNHHTSEVQERLLFEKFNECYIQRTKRISPEEADASKVLPKSPLLKDVPPNDFRRIYKVYFGKEVLEDRGKRKGKEKQAEKTKKAPEKKKSKDKPKEKISTNPILQEVREEFQPFSGEFVSAPSKELLEPEQVDFRDTDSKSETIKNYEQKYLIVYRNLCKAIDTLVDTVELCKNTQTSPGVLSELQTCNILDPSELSHEIEEVNSERSESLNKSDEVPRKPSIKKNIDKIRSTTLHIPRVSEALVQVIADEEYTEFLVNSHLKRNSLTKKYIVREETSDEPRRTDNEIDTEAILKQALSNVFSLSDLKRESIPFGYVDAEIQTTDSRIDVMEDLHKYLSITDPILTEISETCVEEEKATPEEQVVVEKSSDIFYFLDDIMQGEDHQ